MTAPLSWVVGAGGLLGTSTVAALRHDGPVWSPGRQIPWGHDDAARVLREAFHAFLLAADGRQWQVAWCAGAGVVGSTPQDTAREIALFERFLQMMSERTRGDASQGALFLASSAGGVYAGASGAPFRESSPTAPISPYGHAKLELESIASRFARATSTPVAIGRIANLYGPNQNLAKPQGLISQICRSQLRGQPMGIYVPLDTVRDYIFADDCGALVAATMARLRSESRLNGPDVHIKVLASQQGVTIGYLVAELRRIFKRAPRIVYGTSPSARFQVRDLRMRSDVWPEIDRRTLTPLPAGIKQTLDALTRSLQRARLA